jgi:WD40 repeat protein
MKTDLFSEEAEMARHPLSNTLFFATILLLAACSGIPTPLMNGRPTTKQVTRPPTLTATPTPDGHVITSANAANVAPLARLGKGVFHQAAISPDGSTLAIASSIGIYFYNARTLDEQRLVETDEVIDHIAYSPDGSLFVTSTDGSSSGTSTDTRIQLRDSLDGKALRSLDDPLDQINTIVFSPDGHKIAAGNPSGEVKVWSTDTGKVLHTFTDFQDHVFALAFSPDGNTLAGGGYDRRLVLWNTITGQAEQIFDDDSTAIVTAIAYSPDGRTLAWSNGGGSIPLWDISSHRTIRKFQHPGGIASMAFSSDGKRLISAGGYQGEDKDATLIVWDVATGMPTVTMDGHTEGITSALLNPNGQTLFSTDEQNVMRLWDTTSGQLLEARNWIAIDGNAIAFSPHGQDLIAINPQRGLQLWDVKTHDLIRIFAEQVRDIIDVAFSHDGQTITSINYDAVVHAWDADNSSLLRTFKIPGRTAAFSPDDRTLASAQVHGDDIWLLDLQTGQKFDILTTTQPSGVGIMEFSPQGQVLASASNSYFEPGIRIWDVKANKLLREVSKNSHGISTMAFSPDGGILASSEYGGFVILQNINTEQAAPTQILHRLPGHAIAFSPDGHIIATSVENDVILWDTSSGQRLAQLKGHTASIWHIVFSPDGKTLATTSTDGTVRLWGIQ